MTRISIESATLFTPGRASYIDETNVLQLTDASNHRAEAAADAYSSDIHDVAVFAGGFPGLAQGWVESLTPPADRREAHLMAVPLINRLQREGISSQEIDKVVATQGDSSNSFGDVIISVERGLLEPNKFNENKSHGIDLNTGALHGRRFRIILSRVLDIDPKRIRRLDMRDVYGTPEYPSQSAESAVKAVAKELAALAVTGYILRDVKSGDIESLKEAEQRFINIASKHS